MTGERAALGIMVGVFVWSAAFIVRMTQDPNTYGSDWTVVATLALSVVIAGLVAKARTVAAWAGIVVATFLLDVVAVIVIWFLFFLFDPRVIPM